MERCFDKTRRQQQIGDLRENAQPAETGKVITTRNIMINTVTIMQK